MKERTRKTFTNLWYFLALGFGSGLAPRAPGTFGTLAALPVYFAISHLGPVAYALWVFLAFVFGIWLCGHVANDMKVKDPGCIVWDEFVGLWITLFMLPVGWYWIFIGFGLFRFFDIVKPWPVSWADKSLSGGMGIMVDDVLAGFYGLACIQLANFLISSNF
ncbi:phosphatidylglycerophosphatase A [Pseudomonadales bacterium]|nr:phosphatidylglycerophosphatase A [Gammaproteobacteria bacterium]MDA8880242.1 phosphatidylglycerophosphatase A [Pseudomonadales bacterium]MDC1479299.1 phosphatidylglycerophosphatase A [Pseudomonadales bacterium]|tara:strand:- start:7373 stop:7858 length:486 start_codon:yes stop_codon:yes gene_type:complete